MACFSVSVGRVGGWVGAGVSDIWEEEEKKTGAKLISVWATFSSALSFPLRNIKETQMQLFTAPLWQSRGSSRDDSTQAAFVLDTFKWIQSGGERGVNMKLSHFSS